MNIYLERKEIWKWILSNFVLNLSKMVGVNVFTLDHILMVISYLNKHTVIN